MMKMRLKLLILLMPILSGCVGFYALATFHPKTSVGFTKDEQRTLTHRFSDMEFPASIGEFKRGSVHIYDSHGHDVSVGYSLDGSIQCVINIYVYPFYRSLEKNASEMKEAIEYHHPTAVLVSESSVSHNHLGTDHRGVMFTHTYEEEFKNQKQAVVSDTYVYKYNSWFLQYRITYPSRFQPEMAPQLTFFLSELEWP